MFILGTRLFEGIINITNEYQSRKKKNRKNLVGLGEKGDATCEPQKLAEFLFFILISQKKSKRYF